MKLKPPVRLFYIFFLQFFFLSASFAQTISATLTAIDRRSGVQISPEFTVVKLPGNTPVKVSTNGFERSISVLTGEKILIKASLDGYYPEQKTYDIGDNFTSEGRNIVFDLDPQPAANVNFSVRDKINGKKLASTATFIIDGKVIKNVKSNETGDYENIILTQPGEYTVEVLVKDYELQRKSASIVVNDPPEKFSLDILMSQSQRVFIVKTVDGSSMTPITGVDLKVSGPNGKTMYKAVTTEDFTEISVDKEKELLVEASLQGFEVFKQTVDINIKSPLTVQLKPLAVVSVIVLDKSANEQIPVVVVFTAPDGKKINVKSNRQGVVTFTPEVKGSYAYVVEQTGFATIKSEVQVTELTGKKYDLKIDLLPEVQSVVISIVDDNGSKIANANLTVLNQVNAEQVLSKKDGSWSLRLKKGDNYRYVAKADGYRQSENPLQTGKNLDEVGIVLVKEVIAQLKAIDKYTEKPIKTTIFYSGRETAPAFEHNVAIGSAKDAKPIVKATGYEDYQVEAINTQTLSTVLMLAEFYPITFVFTNSSTGAIISPDLVSIKKVKTGIAVKDKGNFVYDLAAEESYSIFVKKDKFTDYATEFLPSSVINKNAAVKEIKLNSVEKLRQRISLVDVKTGQPVSINEIVLTDNYGVKTTIQKENNAFVVAVDGEKPFSIAVSAAGYKAFTNKYNRPVENELVIKLEKEASNDIVFEAYDEILERTVPAKFTLITDEKMNDLPTFDGGIHAKAELPEGKEFTIRISAPDYQDQEKSLVAKNLVKTQQISFKRNFYPIKIIVEPENQDFSLAAVRIKINGDGQKISTSYQPDLATFNGEFRPGEAYSVSVEADGFEPISQMVKLSDIVKQNLTKTFKLKQIPLTAIKKEPEIKIEPKVDSIATPPVLKVETVYERNKEKLEAIPTSDVEMLETLSKKEAIGRRYILTKVYFNQSEATMKPESDEQLAQILKVMRENDKIKVELVGHTDNVGDTRQNTYLSKFRAKVISSFLFNKGITDDRIIIKGMGDKYPVEPNDTEENMAKNRRVELIVIEN